MFVLQYSCIVTHITIYQPVVWDSIYLDQLPRTIRTHLWFRRARRSFPPLFQASGICHTACLICSIRFRDDRQSTVFWYVWFDGFHNGPSLRERNFLRLELFSLSVQYIGWVWILLELRGRPLSLVARPITMTILNLMKPIPPSLISACLVSNHVTTWCFSTCRWTLTFCFWLVSTCRCIFDVFWCMFHDVFWCICQLGDRLSAEPEGSWQFDERRCLFRLFWDLSISECCINIKSVYCSFLSSFNLPLCLYYSTVV